MNRMVIVLMGGALAASLCYGQGSTPAPAQAAPAAIGHGSFPVKVIKTLDSSKLKEDDTVEVETASAFKLPDGTLVPKGSKLTGRVTAAKARSKGDPESQLTLTFNKLNIANGKQLSINGYGAGSISCHPMSRWIPASPEPRRPLLVAARVARTAGAGGASVAL